MRPFFNRQASGGCQPPGLVKRFYVFVTGRLTPPARLYLSDDLVNRLDVFDADELLIQAAVEVASSGWDRGPVDAGSWRAGV